MREVLSDLFQFNLHLLLAFVISPWIYAVFPGFILGTIHEQLKFRKKFRQAEKLVKWSFVGYGYFFALCFWAIATGNFPAI